MKLSLIMLLCGFCLHTGWTFPMQMVDVACQTQEGDVGCRKTYTEEELLARLIPFQDRTTELERLAGAQQEHIADLDRAIADRDAKLSFVIERLESQEEKIEQTVGSLSEKEQSDEGWDRPGL